MSEKRPYHKILSERATTLRYAFDSGRGDLPGEIIVDVREDHVRLIVEDSAGDIAITRIPWWAARKLVAALQAAIPEEATRG